MNSNNIGLRPLEAGSTILMSLVVMTVGTVGLASWISLLSARSSHINNKENVLSHRIAELNSRSVARESLYSRALTIKQSAPRFISMPNSDCRTIIPAIKESAFSSTTTVNRIVSVGQGNGHGFQVEIPVSMNVERKGSAANATRLPSSTYLRNYLLRSRSAQLSGDLIVMHRPKSNTEKSQRLSGNIKVYGNTLIWAPKNIFIGDSLRTSTYMIPTIIEFDGAKAIRNLDGQYFPPSNFTMLAMTSSGVGSRSVFSGEIDIIDPSHTESWSMKESIEEIGCTRVRGNVTHNNGRGVTSNGLGKIEIDLGSPFLPNIHIEDNVSEVHFHGQSNFIFSHANRLSEVAVIITQSSESILDLSRIFFHGKSNRRLVVAVKKNIQSSYYDVQYAFTEASINPLWRMILIAEDTPLKILEEQNPSGQVTIQGGIATDQSFEWSENGNKKLNVIRETDPKFLEYLAPRSAWIESYPNTN
jgi:hypothetical protein